MPSLQEQRRNLIVHFLNRIRGVDPEWRKVTAAHFVAEGIPKRTVYDIIKRYLVRGTVERRRGSGRPARKMDSRNRQRLKRMVNHKTGLSQRALASTFGCHTCSPSSTTTTLEEATSSGQTKPAPITHGWPPHFLTANMWTMWRRVTTRRRCRNADLSRTSLGS